MSKPMIRKYYYQEQRKQLWYWYCRWTDETGKRRHEYIGKQLSAEQRAEHRANADWFHHLYVKSIDMD